MQGSREKVGQIIKIQAATKVFVEILLNGCTVKVNSNFYIVLAKLPSEIIEDLAVAVHAVPRNAAVGANLSERSAINIDDRQTGVAHARSRTGCRGAGSAEPHRARVEVLILREESFRKTVPAIAQLVGLVQTNRVHVGKRYQLHPGRSESIKTGKRPAARCKGQGKRLNAVSEEVAPGQVVARVEGLVDFCDETGQAVIGRRIERCVRTIRTSGVAGMNAWYVWRRPGIVSGQQVGNDRVRGVGWTERSTWTRALWYTTRRYHPHAFLLSLVVGVKESLIFDDGSSERTSVLIVVEWGFRLAAEVEIIPGIKRIVPEVLSCCSVQGVRAALGHNVNDCARTATVLRLKIREYIYFGDRVDRKNRGGRTEHAGFIDGRVVAVAVIHVGSIKQVIVRPSSRAVHAEFAVRSGRIGNLVGGA